MRNTNKRLYQLKYLPVFVGSDEKKRIKSKNEAICTIKYDIAKRIDEKNK